MQWWTAVVCDFMHYCARSALMHYFANVTAPLIYFTCTLVTKGPTLVLRSRREVAATPSIVKLRMETPSTPCPELFPASAEYRSGRPFP